jgi:hypothetical protein
MQAELPVGTFLYPNKHRLHKQIFLLLPTGSVAVDCHLVGIIALANLTGFSTSASCEGCDTTSQRAHLSSAYIDFVGKIPEGLRKIYRACPQALESFTSIRDSKSETLYAWLYAHNKGWDCHKQRDWQIRQNLLFREILTTWAAKLPTKAEPSDNV